MSNLVLLSRAYVLVALLCAIASVFHSLRVRQRPREELTGVERLLMATGGVIVSALWIVALAVVVVGWVRDRLPGHLVALRARLRRRESERAPLRALPAEGDAAVVPLERRWKDRTHVA